MVGIADEHVTVARKLPGFIYRYGAPTELVDRGLGREKEGGRSVVPWHTEIASGVVIAICKQSVAS